MNRTEHVEWCKKRALEYLDKGDLKNAFISMMSDIKKHPETEKHIGILLGIQLSMGGFLNTSGKLRKFIEGFN